MTQLTLEEIAIEAAMESGEPVLGWWEKHNKEETSFTIVQYKDDMWVLPDIDDDGDYRIPTKVFRLPGGVK